MNIVVFTPTAQYGGLDIAWSSLARQTVAKDITWMVADTMIDKRADLYLRMDEEPDLREVVALDVPVREGYPNNLASAYVLAMEKARQMDADVFISYQDYIYLDDWQVEWFLHQAQTFPNDLGTGLCSITDNPGKEAVADPAGLYTIFAEPYVSRPAESYWWSDLTVRGLGRLDPPGIYPGDPYCWELNWAVIPRNLLHDDTLNFDPEFDRGIGKDHQVYAKECMERRGARVLIDTRNHVLGLPHKLYFPEVTEARGEVVQANVDYSRETYGI